MQPFTTLSSPESEAALFADVRVPAAGVAVSRPLVHVQVVLLRRAVRAMLASEGLFPCKNDTVSDDDQILKTFFLHNQL